MSALALQTMTGLVTQPYSRGAESLELPVGADAGGFTSIDSYDYREYLARYGTLPMAQKYILYLKSDVLQTDLDIDVRYTVAAGPEQTVTVHVPQGSMSGSSSPIPLPAGSDATVRFTRFRQLPVALPGAGAQNFGIVALLGNIAKLCWVLGGEKDEIRRQQTDIRLQRHVETAHGASLDNLGSDLRVPRFPGRPYSFDPDTIALYHFEDVIGTSGVAADDTTRFGLAGHPATNQNAQSGITAKFGLGFRVPGPGGTGALEVAPSADFDLLATQSFTAEIFLKTSGNTAAVPAVVLGKGALDVTGTLSESGWSMTVGSFRGTDNNLRWAGSDDINTFEIFSDIDLDDGAFHHVAGLIDRSTQRALLLVDGEIAAKIDITSIGAMTNASTVRVGSTAAGLQLTAVFDELRFSRIARYDFDPVLGEGDDSYRKRLGIFRRWQLPTPPAMLETINSLIQINGNAESFVLVEQNKQGASGSGVVRVIPASIAPGVSFAKDGSSMVQEAGVAGLPSDDTDFDPMYLIQHNSAHVNYGTTASSHLMQVVTGRVLDNLLSLLAAVNPAIVGRLIVQGSFSPLSTGLGSVGRALQLAHESLSFSQLAVFAHRAGFDFVSNTGSNVYASVVAGEKLDISDESRAATEIPKDGSDLFAGHFIDLDLSPSGVTAAGIVQWTLMLGSIGNATLLPHPADPVTMTTPIANRRRLRLRADAPGQVTLRLEFTYKRVTVTATRVFQITVDTLADGQTITANGDLTAHESTVVSPPEATFNTAYLITPAITVNFGADPNNKLMQLVIEESLLRLLGLLTAEGATASDLQIVKSFDPADSGLHKVGRAIRMSHPGIDPGVLTALAFQSGFDFVRREAAVVYASVEIGEKIEIAQLPGLTSLPSEMVLGVPVPLQARFTTLPATGTYNWSIPAIGNGSGNSDFVLRPQMSFTPTTTGLVGITLNYLEDDPAGVFPYTFELRLQPTLDVPATIIPKPQYDLLMNMVSYFHPVGIEVITTNIREHVVEVRENLLNAFPGYTYPDFRV